MMKGRRLFIVLDSTQTLAWASSYYLPAVLADDMSRDLGLLRAPAAPAHAD